MAAPPIRSSSASQSGVVDDTSPFVISNSTSFLTSFRRSRHLVKLQWGAERHHESPVASGILLLLAVFVLFDVSLTGGKPGRDLPSRFPPELRSLATAGSLLSSPKPFIC
jgi:hypothetical protein